MSPKSRYKFSKYLAAKMSASSSAILIGLAMVDMIDVRGKQVRSSRAFTEDEIRRLLSVASCRRIVYLMLLYTGQRKEEVHGLVWGDVQLDDANPYALFRDTTTKDKKKRAVSSQNSFIVYGSTRGPSGVGGGAT